MKFYNYKRQHVATLGAEVKGTGKYFYRVEWRLLPGAPMTPSGYGKIERFRTMDLAISETLNKISLIWKEE